MFWLIIRKAQVQTPNQNSEEMKLSGKASQKSIVWSRLITTSPATMCKINAYNVNDVISYIAILTDEF